MDDTHADPLSGLLERSRSAEWGDRATDPEAFQRLVELLDDANEAVVEVAARALLVWTGAEGADVVFTRLAAGETETPTASDVEVSEVIRDELLRRGADGLCRQAHRRQHRRRCTSTHEHPHGGKVDRIVPTASEILGPSSRRTPSLQAPYRASVSVLLVDLDDTLLPDVVARDRALAEPVNLFEAPVNRFY